MTRAPQGRGRVGGRPRALSEEDLAQVQVLMKDPDASTAQICERFNVSKATLYRYVAPNGKRRKEGPSPRSHGSKGDSVPLISWHVVDSQPSDSGGLGTETRRLMSTYRVKGFTA